jgi:hypothetical protein
MSTSSQTRTMIMKICPIIEIISHRNQQPNTALEPTAAAPCVWTLAITWHLPLRAMLRFRGRGSALDR